MAKAYYEGKEDEWVEFKEPMPAIAVDDLMAASALQVTTRGAEGKHREWLTSAIVEWHLPDGDGKLLTGKPTAEAIGRLDYPHIKFIAAEGVRATVELPPQYGSPLKSEPTPAATA